MNELTLFTLGAVARLGATGAEILLTRLKNAATLDDAIAAVRAARAQTMDELKAAARAERSAQPGTADSKSGQADNAR